MDLIILEGIDGSGKSTLHKNLAKALKTYTNRPIIAVRHPGSTAVGREIRKILKDNDLHIDGLTYQLLMSAETSAFVNEYKDNKDAIIISDRSNLISCLAYGIADGVPYEQLNRICSICAPLKASRVYVLNVPLEVAKERLRRRNEAATDRFDDKGLAFFKVLKSVYDNLFDNVNYKYITETVVDRDDLITIDANCDEITLTSKVLVDLLVRLPL